MLVSDPKSHLLQIIKSHSLPLSQKDVAWVFDDSSRAQEIEEYAIKYLSPSTLLSVEEKELYDNLSKAKPDEFLRVYKQAGGEAGISAIRAGVTDEQEMKAEIEKLKEETELIIKRREVVKRQMDVIKEMKKAEGEINQSRKRLRERRRKRWRGEIEKVELEVKSLGHMLQGVVTDLDKEFRQNKQVAAGDFLPSVPGDVESLQEWLKGDDKILLKLERLAHETEVPNEDEANTNATVTEKVRQMTDILSSLCASLILHRLDRIYLETCETSPVSSTSEETEKILTLKLDLESLYTEIPTVAKMSAEAEFLRPVMGEMKKRKDMIHELLEARGGYIRDVLLYMANRNVLAIEQLKEDLSKRMMLKELSLQLEELLKSPLPGKRKRKPHYGVINESPKSKEKQGQALPKTPGRSASPSKHLPPHLRMPVATPKRAPIRLSPRKTLQSRRKQLRRRKSIEGDEEFINNEDEDINPPEIDLLLHLGISLPEHLLEDGQSYRILPETPYISRNTAAGIASITMGRDGDSNNNTPPCATPFISPENDAKKTRAHLNKQVEILEKRLHQQITSVDTKLIPHILNKTLSEVSHMEKMLSSILFSDCPYNVRLSNTTRLLIPPGIFSETKVMKPIREVESEVEGLTERMKKVVMGMEELEAREDLSAGGLGLGGEDGCEKRRFVERWGR